MDVEMRRLLPALLTALLIPAPAAALPLLLEVLYDGPGADADDVFTEIAGVPGFAMDGWTLRGINGANGAVYRTVLLTGAVIPADGLLVLATTSASGAVLAARDFVADVDWQNGPDALELLDPDDVIVDALQYGSTPGFNAGEGDPAPDVGAGRSLTRNDIAADTDDNRLDFRVADPSPGSGYAVPQTRIAPVPAPATLLLYGPLVAALLVLCRNSTGSTARPGGPRAGSGSTPRTTTHRGFDVDHDWTQEHVVRCPEGHGRTVGSRCESSSSPLRPVTTARLEALRPRAATTAIA